LIPPLQLLYEPEGLPAYNLPEGVAAFYPGSFGFTEPRLVANFVATVDGVVAIPSIPNSNRLISGGSKPDRFVMGMLRASADALVIGSGTLAAAPSSLWTPAQAYPDAADDFAELRRRTGREQPPQLVVLSATGRIDPEHPAFADGAILLTTDEGASRVSGKLPEPAVLSLGSGPDLDLSDGVTFLRDRGYGLILTEGGPHVLGQLLAGGLVDEVFLTVSPLVVGRTAADPRLALVEGVDLTSPALPPCKLIGVRREADHLFLRYEAAE
jgi:riboflavin biosynthesis pyrimidine reductase